jgi:hypothetical protein
MPQQIKYERIFWLEDNPEFLGYFQGIADSQHIPIDLVNLLNRTTFAYDHEMGREIILREHPFDLYVLDADIPRSLSILRRELLSDFIEKIKEQQSAQLPFIEAGPGQSYFIDFWEELLKDRTGQAKVVVFSANLDAQVDAYQRELPFYSKRFTGWNERAGIINWVGKRQRFCKRPITPEDLAAWECGGIIDLLKNHLALQEPSR